MPYCRAIILLMSIACIPHTFAGSISHYSNYLVCFAKVLAIESWN